MNEAAGLKAAERAASGALAEALSRERVDPGSYRDRNGAIFYRDGRVLRYLSQRALANWEQLRQTSFFQEGSLRGSIVETWAVDAGEEGISLGPWAGVLEHKPIPYISYPYEWSFGMLKDAALLHLDLMRDALAADMILKDSSPYNIQWKGVHPVFIDIPSFEPLGAGEPWVGYRQFCELFLYPLMLEAYKRANFRPLLRGRIDGVPADEMRALMSSRDLLRPGVLLHIIAQSALQRHYGGSGRDVRGPLAEAGFGKALIERNVAKLKALVAKLEPASARTQWSEYDRTHSYEKPELARKAEFVRRAVARRHWRLAWDLGCNTGTFSRIVAENADYVVAMDGDGMAIERLYRQEKTDASSWRILPLVMNLADASPNQGWRGAERKGIAERGRPELVLCLALIHHIVITANIPLADFLDWLAGLNAVLIIEFVDREDEMVQALLANRDDQYDDYHPDIFRSLLSARFDIKAEEALKGGKRYIFHAEPRVAAAR